MHPSQRIALCLHYDGSQYYGWQNQEGLVTVQKCVERALSCVANHSISVTCAGRTDAGVHATAQIVHFDTEAIRSEYSWVFGANSHLPPDISVVWAKCVWLDFHARFSATARKYQYVIYNHEIRPAILRNSMGWYFRFLEENRMREAIQYLIGEYDFSAFRGAGCQARSPIRAVHSITIIRHQCLVIIEIEANAFLLHMVRNIVGVLVAIGCGDKPPLWAKQVLESRDRRQGGVTISPNGLYLVEVKYPPEFELPQISSNPFFLSQY